jgi:hypothetical protein
VDVNGRLLALNTFHPQHGYVTLTVANPYPEDRRYDQAAVRAYRAGLVTLNGFGPDVTQPVVQRQAFLLADMIPEVCLAFANGRYAETVVWAHEGGATQIWEIEEAPRWRGKLSLQRCAYTQLTEGGPLTVPPVQSRVSFVDGVLTIENPNLGWAAAVAGFPPSIASWTRETGGPIEIDLEGRPGTTVLTYGFGPDATAAREHAIRLAQQEPLENLENCLGQWRTYLDGSVDDPLVRRGLAYSLALVVPVGETRCILTDHMLLPLSWNRDAYYVARALLSWRAECAEMVKRHLLWLFEVADRPDDTWGRCYLANGQIKDRAFQLDQQLFPVLELAEYVLETGDRATWDRLQPMVVSLTQKLLARKAPYFWLFPTDETPADDPLALPYHLSSHLLMWRTFRKLADLIPDHDLLTMADSIRRAIQHYFIADHQGQRVYAYATDGDGCFHFYHDANDTPLALAPAWGFTTEDDPVWRATIDFAFSEANVGGYYAPGLGSVHTPGPWPLGDVQDLLIARTIHDTERERCALERLSIASQWDGALPEAYDPATGTVISRHWFVWPNALLASVASGAFVR